MAFCFYFSHNWLFFVCSHQCVVVVVVSFNLIMEYDHARHEKEYFLCVVRCACATARSHSCAHLEQATVGRHVKSAVDLTARDCLPCQQNKMKTLLWWLAGGISKISLLLSRARTHSHTYALIIHSSHLSIYSLIHSSVHHLRIRRRSSEWVGPWIYLFSVTSITET